MLLSLISSKLCNLEALSGEIYFTTYENPLILEALAILPKTLF